MASVHSRLRCSTSSGSAAHLGLWVCLFLLCSARVDAAPVHFALIDRVTSASQQLDGLVAAQGDVGRLPDAWPRSHPGFTGTIWYRASLMLPGAPPTEPLGIYIPRACTHLDVRLNLVVVESDNFGDEAAPAGCSRPRLIMLPSAALHTGDNVLDVSVTGTALRRLTSVQDAAGLSSIEVGDGSDLVVSHLFGLVVEPLLIGAERIGLVGLGFVLLTMGWLRQRETQYLYLGALCLLWGAVSLSWWARYLPSNETVNALLQGSVWSLLVALAVQFSLRMVRLRSKQLEGLLCLQVVLMPASLWLAGPDQLFSVAKVWYILFALELAWAQWIVLLTTARERPRALKVLSLIAYLIVLCVVIELGRQLQYLAPADGHATQLIAPLLIFAFGVRLILRFNRSLQTIETDREYLVRQLQGLAVDVETRAERMAQERANLMRENERKRIASDLHDDLGAKLLTIAHTSDVATIPDLAREALDEMRLAVRGMTGKPVNLADALGDWRAEIVGRLGQAQIAGIWEDQGARIPHVLSARVFMQLTRILREAVSNVIKHSAASRCKVRWEVEEGTLRMAVRDDGKGIAEELRGGQGVSSMKVRAKRINGQCLVESRPGHGVEVSLTVPLE
jgi:two-component system, NarL family, sensor histidine kinase UhpB